MLLRQAGTISDLWAEVSPAHLPAPVPRFEHGQACSDGLPPLHVSSRKNPSTFGLSRPYAVPLTYVSVNQEVRLEPLRGFHNYSPHETPTPQSQYPDWVGPLTLLPWVSPWQTPSGPPLPPPVQPGVCSSSW